ncbi:MAG TPA: Imm21 family immunity protein [Stellaceae bacterium]|nr:Imm21 family immunity protein [Stellaceae bacterium]
MKWLQYQGPLILCDEALLPFWGGVSNVGGIAGEGDDNWIAGLPSDYGRACQASGWIDMLPVGGGQVAVLWGEPLSTTVHRLSSGAWVIARCYYASGDTALFARLREVREDIFSEDEEKTITFPSGYAHLFEGGLPGLLSRRNEIVIPIKERKYNILTIEYNPDKEISMVLHLLKEKK